MSLLKENNSRLLKQLVINKLLCEKLDTVKKILNEMSGKYIIGSSERRVFYNVKMLRHGKYSFTRKICTPTRTIVSDTLVVG